MVKDPEAFAAYHRGEIPRRIAAVAGVMLAIGAVTAGAIAVGAAAPSARAADAVVPATAPSAAAAPAPASAPTLAAIDSSDPTAAPTASAPPVAPVPQPLAATGPARYAIDITATGYQTELDRCQWVRMDLVPDEPIVGAHTSCGGVIVLRMTAGDEVVLTGHGLDGRYVVGSARDAHAGDVAATALAGLGGTVVLQTCYPGTSGRERLVALTPES